MDTVAYALRPEFQGTVDIETDEGSETVPKFGGGLIAAGDGDFDVAAALDAGGGTIVVHGDDQRLVDVLDFYPALERVESPEGAAPTVSRYERATTDDLRTRASLAGVDGAQDLSRSRLIAALEDRDADRDLVADEGLAAFSVPDLRATAHQRDVAVGGSARKQDIVDALDAAGITPADVEAATTTTENGG